MPFKSVLSAVVFARSIRSAEPLPLPQTQPNAACKNHTTKKTKKNLTFPPGPCYNIRMKWREKKNSSAAKKDLTFLSKLCIMSL